MKNKILKNHAVCPSNTLKVKRHLVESYAFAIEESKAEPFQMQTTEESLKLWNLRTRKLRKYQNKKC